MKASFAVAALAIGLGCLGVSSANAAQEFTLDYNDGTAWDASAQITATLNGGVYDITNITGTVTENGTVYDITGLLSSTSYFSFDNEIFGTAGHYYLDSNGIAFNTTAPTYYPLQNQPTSVPPVTTAPSEFNIWGIDGNSYATTSFYQLANTANDDVNRTFNGTATISAVPEAANWAMMLIGFCGLGALMRGRRSRLVLAS